MRIEYGAERNACTCANCVAGCLTMPGFLIPEDLERLLPAEAREEYLLKHFLASEGSKAWSMTNGFISIKTIVPAQKGGCVFLDRERCTIWESAPFGCAFFRVCVDAPRDDFLLTKALTAVLEDANANGPYAQAWRLLRDNRRIAAPIKLRKDRLIQMIHRNERRFRAAPSQK